MGNPLDEDTGDDLARTVVDEQPTVSAEPPIRPLSFTRGMNVRGAVGWVRQHHGERGVQQLAAALPQDLVAGLGGPSLTPGQMEWVPFLSHALLLEEIDRRFGVGDLALLLGVGRAMAKADVPMLLRPVARLLSPSLFLSMVTKVWGLYHSEGRWEIVRGDRELTAMLLERREHHAAFCAAMRGWVEGAFAICGATSVLTHEERCAARGAPACSYRMRWHERHDDVRDRTPRPPT